MWGNEAGLGSEESNIQNAEILRRPPKQELFETWMSIETDRPRICTLRGTDNEWMFVSAAGFYSSKLH